MGTRVDNTVAPSEVCIYSFIVKVRIEDGATRMITVMITQVPGRERRYLKGLDEIPAFIESRVRPNGLAGGTGGRLSRYFVRLKRALRGRS